MYMTDRRPRQISEEQLENHNHYSRVKRKHVNSKLSMIHQSYQRSLSKRQTNPDTSACHAQTASKTTRGWYDHRTDISPNRSFNYNGPERKASTKEILLKYTNSETEPPGEFKEEDILKKQLGNFLNERFPGGNQSRRDKVEHIAPANKVQFFRRNKLQIKLHLEENAKKYFNQMIEHTKRTNVQAENSQTNNIIDVLKADAYRETVNLGLVPAEKSVEELEEVSRKSAEVEKNPLPSRVEKKALIPSAVPDQRIVAREQKMEGPVLQNIIPKAPADKTQVTQRQPTPPTISRPPDPEPESRLQEKHEPLPKSKFSQKQQPKFAIQQNAPLLPAHQQSITKKAIHQQSKEPIEIAEKPTHQVERPAIKAASKDVPPEKKPSKMEQWAQLEELEEISATTKDVRPGQQNQTVQNQPKQQPPNLPSNNNPVIQKQAKPQPQITPRSGSGKEKTIKAARPQPTQPKPADVQSKASEEKRSFKKSNDEDDLEEISLAPTVPAPPPSKITKTVEVIAPKKGTEIVPPKKEHPKPVLKTDIPILSKQTVEAPKPKKENPPPSSEQIDQYVEHIIMHEDIVALLGEYIVKARKIYDKTQFKWFSIGYYLYSKFVYEREKLKRSLLGLQNCFKLKNMEVPSDALKYCLQHDDIAQLKDELVQHSQKVQECLNEHYQKALANDKSIKKVGKDDPYIEARKALSGEYRFVAEQASTTSVSRQLKLRKAYLIELLFVLEQLAGNYIKDHEDQTEIENLQAYLSTYSKRAEQLLI